MNLTESLVCETAKLIFYFPFYFDDSNSCTIQRQISYSIGPIDFVCRSVYVINGWHPNIHIDTSTSPTKKRTILVWQSHFGLQSSVNFMNTQFL
ncbi:unnamed protein product [Lactuca virosa]|uniref:Uncharacterized protein n=1 Tax=Lactuca virosa TaxID=75947 RepID=A0AAU9LH49_9ASTR|nr:unnamed protein product [Lactuca virosa]